MLLIAVTPWWVYAGYILAVVYGLSSKRPILSTGIGLAAVNTRYLIALAQLIMACVSLFLTHQRSISGAACVTGYFGFQVNAVLLAAEALLYAGALVLLPGSRLARALKADRWFYVFLLVTSALAMFIHLRAILLCTV